MKNNENIEICKKCRGTCCRRMPGQYVPEDLFDHEMTKEELKQFILDMGNISIDCWDGNKDSDFKDFYYLRPMRRKLTLNETIENMVSKEHKDPKQMAAEEVDELYRSTYGSRRIIKYFIENFKDQDLTVDYAYPEMVLVCCHLTENGCDLQFDKRPTNCKELVPSENGCYIEGIKEKKLLKLYYAKKWEKYNDMLREIANEIEFGNYYEEYFEGDEE